MSDKKPITVSAEHQAYGVVEFTLLAKDAKGAFDTWKQLVAYPRHWIVMHNSGNDTDTGGNDGGAIRHTNDCEDRYSDGHACSVHRGIVSECACACHGQKPEPAPARKFVAEDDWHEA